MDMLVRMKYVGKKNNIDKNSRIGVKMRKGCEKIGLEYKNKKLRVIKKPNEE